MREARRIGCGHRGIVSPAGRDPTHSRDEERFKAIGRTDDGRSVVIVFTLRHRAGENFVRPISARYMHAKEIANYEEEAAKTGQR